MVIVLMGFCASIVVYKYNTTMVENGLVGVTLDLRVCVPCSAD